MCTQFEGLGLPLDSSQLAWPILVLLLLSALPDPAQTDLQHEASLALGTWGMFGDGTVSWV